MIGASARGEVHASSAERWWELSEFSTYLKSEAMIVIFCSYLITLIIDYNFKVLHLSWLDLLGLALPSHCSAVTIFRVRLGLGFVVLRAFGGVRRRSRRCERRTGAARDATHAMLRLEGSSLRELVHQDIDTQTYWPPSLKAAKSSSSSGCSSDEERQVALSVHAAALFII